MINKVLIANRGEIAVRIARACRDYGVGSVAVYADSDADAMHVRMADEAWALQGARPIDTYLSIDKLIAIARQSGADAVHPGYGFLAERADFAKAVLDAGLIWIGPRPETIEALGDKVSARKIAAAAGAPLVAGTAEPVKDSAEVIDFARKHGLPVAIKAAFGGGGRGLKVAWQMEEIAELYESAVREATTAFGRGECFLEQFLDRPRHLEAQVIADQHGNVVVLGTRDCSLQRRNQKLVEEAPAPFLSPEQREQIHRAARDICLAAGYQSAGTVEFLLGRNGQISFLEVNTRLQVEHPVTEETSGVDLVVEQLRIADGLPLSFDAAPPVHGHSIEFRINAEDPGRGYLPTPGLITCFEAPSGPGVRVDTGVSTGSSIPGSFDSLMAKLVVTGQTREQALIRARRALREFRIEGVASVLPFHRAVVEDPAFTAEAGFGVHTRWIETEMTTDFEAAARPTETEENPLLRSWIEIDGRRLQLGLPATLAVQHAGLSTRQSRAETPAAGKTEPGDVTCPLAGNLVRWHYQNGEQVEAGEIIATIEAMKMETGVPAPCRGILEQRASAGDAVQAGQCIAHVATAEE